MTNPEIYGWQSLYLRAILETDDLLMGERNYEAISALEQRRLSPVENNSDEDCALNKTEAGIKALITERRGWRDLSGVQFQVTGQLGFESVCPSRAQLWLEWHFLADPPQRRAYLHN